MRARSRWTSTLPRRFRERARRSGEPWRRFEVEQAREMQAAGRSAEEIGLRLGRTARAVREKLGGASRW